VRVSIHPYVRILFLIAGLCGAIFCENDLALFLFWVCILIPFMTITNNLKTHIRFLLLVVLPMFGMLSFLQIIVLHNVNQYNEVVLRTVLKLIVYTTIVQFVLIIPPNQIHATFKMWGMKNDVLVTSLGSYIVWIDIISRSNKILTARFARGFIVKRTFIAKLKQLPHLLIPLIVGILRTATERAESWQQKGILYKIEMKKANKVEYTPYFNAIICIVASTWLFLNFYIKWM